MGVTVMQLTSSFVTEIDVRRDFKIGKPVISALPRAIMKTTSLT